MNSKVEPELPAERNVREIVNATTVRHRAKRPAQGDAQLEKRR